MWILLEKIDDKKRQFLIDSSGPCEVGTETFNNFQLYLERKAWTGSGASADTSGELFYYHINYFYISYYACACQEHFKTSVPVAVTSLLGKNTAVSFLSCYFDPL